MDITQCNYFRITNYNNVQEGYYRWTGCTDIINVTSIDPLNTQYVCAKNLIIEDYSAPLDIVFVGLCPSSTPTPTITPTPTHTPVTPTPTPTSVTSTPTPTPSITPRILFVYNLRTGGYYQDVCDSINFGGNPANTIIFSEKPFDSLEVGDHVYGNSSLTIPPSSNFTISDGAKFIQLSGTLIINTGVCP